MILVFNREIMSDVSLLSNLKNILMMRDTDAFPRVSDFTSTFYLKLIARMFPKCSRVPQNVPQHVPQTMFGELGNEIFSPDMFRDLGNEICSPNVPQIWGTIPEIFEELVTLDKNHGIEENMTCKNDTIMF